MCLRCVAVGVTERRDEPSRLCCDAAQIILVSASIAVLVIRSFITCACGAQLWAVGGVYSLTWTFAPSQRPQRFAACEPRWTHITSVTRAASFQLSFDPLTFIPGPGVAHEPISRCRDAACEYEADEEL